MKAKLEKLQEILDEMENAKRYELKDIKFIEQIGEVDAYKF